MRTVLDPRGRDALPSGAMNDIAILIGVDGGGTGCRARVRAPDGRLLGEGRGGPANVRLGHDLAWANILSAMDAAGIDRAALPDAAIVLGLAGIVDDAGANAMLAAGPGFGRARIVSDGHIACVGAFGGGDGGVLIVGTGSAAQVVTGGRARALFGWGFEIDDRGSGAALGRMAVRAALDAIDGIGPDTPFTTAIRARIGDGAGAIVNWLSTARPADYGALAPLAFTHDADPVAATLIARTARQVDAMIAHMVAVGAPRVALVGGMAAAILPWLDATSHDRLDSPAQDATEGALLLAQEIAGS